MTNASAPLDRRFLTRSAGLLLALMLQPIGSTRAQNFVRNPDFDQPLGADNWTMVYVGNCSESDWYMHGRSTLAHRDKVYGTWDGNYFGAHFRPYTGGFMEAYLSQMVTNLIPGSNYTVTCWASHFQSTFIPPNTEKIRAWMESVGGNGLVASANVSGYCYNNNGWLRYYANNTADANGKIEVRLRTKIVGSTVSQKWLDMDVFFDQVAVMPSWTAAPPPFQILSVNLTNRSATLNWETAMNNKYRLEVSSDLDAWSLIKDDMLATGSTMAYTADVSGFPADAPLYFRVLSKNYVP